MISDYGDARDTALYGELARRSRRRGLVTVVDSRFALRTFRHVSAVTPNEPEAEKALSTTLGSHDAALDAARTLVDTLDLEAAVVTRGREGLAVAERGGRAALIAAHGGHEAVDVTGAGDTVAAVFTVALTAGVDALDSAALANCAASLVVRRLGTAGDDPRRAPCPRANGAPVKLGPPTRPQADAARRPGSALPPPPGRCPRPRERRVRPAARRSRPVSGGGGGARERPRGGGELRPFDPREQGPAPGPSFRRMSGGRSSPPSRGVDHVIVFDEPTVAPVLAALKPDIHAKGTDYTEQTVPERAVVAAYGGRTVICGDPKDHSSSRLIATLEAADASRNSCLPATVAPASPPMAAPEYLRIVEIAEALDRFEGQRVTLKGWLYNRRSSGRIQFLQVRDGSATLQCVLLKKAVPPALFEEVAKLPLESSIVLTGVVKADPRSAMGFELTTEDLSIVSRAEEYPISKKAHGVAFLMDHRHLWLRSSRQHAIVRIRATIVKAIRDYFDQHGFTLVDAPVFTPNACEGTSTLFAVDYFDHRAFLTQSGQLYMEAAAMAHGKAYCFGPTFRAEKSKTRRHLTEFWMVEPEVAYCDLNGVMDLAEDFLCFIVAQVLEKHARELEALGRNVETLRRVTKPFVRLTHSEAVDLINQAIDDGTADRRPAGTEGRDQSEGTEDEPMETSSPLKRARHDDDFGAEEETILGRLFDRPVLVHRYPYEVKAFYMKRDPQDDTRALCVDVLAPEGYGEIIGGGQREDDLEALLSRIESHGLPREAFEWYTDLRRYGSVPHGGFGLGVERTVAWICGLHHVRETIPFPRMMERLAP